MNTVAYQDAIVGAGIVGLAHAYQLARRGRRVVVVERGAKANGASTRNFGMLWPIGQPPGASLDLALRSREIWRGVLAESGLWHDPCGSLHLAYHADEEAVLKEFLTATDGAGYEAAWWEPSRVAERAPGVRADGLRGAMWSATEICVDPREVVAGLPGFLAEKYGVAFRFGCTALDYERPTLRTSGGAVTAENLYVCSGDDLQTLYPEAFAAWGLRRCKLQMLRTAPQRDGWRMGPMLAAGLTLRHYRAFEACPTLPSLRRRFAEESPDYDRYGIHVMASQNGLGELVLGDSHEYDDDIEPFDKDEIDRLVLDYLRGFLNAPEIDITARWHGIYIKHPTEPFRVARPEPGVTLVGGVGGAGMTLSFGVAERATAENLGEARR
jgi:D-hydroxyproline dehydrogenase subunit beta